MKKIFAASLAIIIFLSGTFVITAAQEDNSIPYPSYVYDLNDNPVETPSPFAVEKVLHGEDVFGQPYKNIADILYDEAEAKIYISDTGNNKITVLDKSYSLLTEITSFDNEGSPDTFNEPVGIYIVNKSLYIADSKNSRIVVLSTADYTLERIYQRPEIELLEEDYRFEPSKVVVDKALRLYITADGINQGLIQLEADGSFGGFVGAPAISLDFFDIIWRNFATKEQRDNMIKAVPTEYTSVTMDSDGFIYATSMSEDVPPISKLNGQGENVIRFTSKTPSGDGVYTDKTGTKVISKFTDIAVAKNGTYYVTDTERSRIFAYDKYGTMLYAFSFTGSQQGTFFSPCAIELIDGKLAVADKTTGTVTVFRPTEFSVLLDDAMDSYASGDNDVAKEKLEALLEIAPGYINGIVFNARIDIQEGNYAKALTTLKNVNAKEYYSIAMREVRSDFVRKNFLLIFLGVVILIPVLIFAFIKIKKLKPVVAFSNLKIVKEYRYATYCMIHPFDGFWDIKREKKGSFKAALLLYLSFFIVYAMRIQFSGYLFSDYSTGQVNIIFELLKIFIPLMLWNISNWCFTTLMDGKGTMKDIFITTAYALKPFILLGILLLILSQSLILDEAVIYNALDMITIVWCGALMLFGTMMTHDYGLLKGILSALLTILGMIIILFISLLAINIVQDVITYFAEIFGEIRLRSY